MDFSDHIVARFMERPNRFLVRCECDVHGEVVAFLPNPGRLWELFRPGVRLYIIDEESELESGGGAANRPLRRTRFTCVAVERDGVPVFLHTHATNTVARRLLEEKRIPGLEKAELIRAEVKHGRSRFDFLLHEDGRDLYLEVKSVTLFGNRVAMFPDAVTERGRRHLLELATINEQGPERAAVLFLVHSYGNDWFMPDYHTDLEFSRALLGVRDRLPVYPVAINWRKDLRWGGRVKRLEIPWDYLEREAQDRGAYLLLLKLNQPRTIAVGALGELRFDTGTYIYVGSAMKNLTARIDRHRRRKKQFHWHVDYLRAEADSFVALPIRSSRREECDLVRAVARLYALGPTGFGASDCECATHLFHTKENPLYSQSFHEMLQRFRMRRPDINY